MRHSKASSSKAQASATTAKDTENVLDDKIKVAIAGYLTQRQVYVSSKESRKGKPVVPKKTKSVYNKTHIIKEMFKARILARSKEIAEAKGLSKTFLASRQALSEIEKELSPAEVLKVALMTESWNSGEILDESAKRLHTAAKLGSVTEDFLREIKQKFSAHVVIMIGFPDEDGVPLLSLFESDPPESMEKFSKTRQWKACGFLDTGFEEYIGQRWPAKPSSDVEDTTDYKDLVWFAEVKDPAKKNPRHAPMLTAYPARWTQEKLRKAWRYYCSEVLCFQTNEEKAVIPWKKVEKSPKTYVESVPGLTIEWSDPSRLDADKLKANWVACVKNQEIADGNGQRVGQMPFRFRSSITLGVSKPKDKYQLSLEAARVHKPTYVDTQSGPGKEQKSRKRRKPEKSNELVHTSEDEGSAPPPTKKAKHQDSSDARGGSGAEVEANRQTRKKQGKRKAADQDALGSDVDFDLIDDLIAGAPDLLEETEDETEENFNLDNASSESESDSDSSTSSSSGAATPSVPPITTLGSPASGSGTPAGRPKPGPAGLKPQAKVSGKPKTSKKDGGGAQGKAADEAQTKAAGKAHPKAAGGAQANKAKTAGPAQPKKSGPAQSKKSRAAGTQPLGSAQPKESGPAQPKESSAAGAQPSGSAQPKESEPAQPKESSAAGAQPSGSAQPKESGPAQPKISSAARTQPLSSAEAKQSDAGGAQPSGSAGEQPSGPLDPNIWATELYRAVEVEAGSQLFIPAPEYVPFEPEIFSAGAALAEKKQSMFLLGLNYREEYMDIVPHVDMSYIDQGAFLHNMPPYLRWWHPGHELPLSTCHTANTFHPIPYRSTSFHIIHRILSHSTTSITDAYFTHDTCRRYSAFISTTFTRRMSIHASSTINGSLHTHL
ncbi:hypothetical protein FIBSPDRAFT_961235 [Athelia psychrophila]|uniref:Uncharacterized protein n=1 Tax=Athelia psychrophila TaxID=1759441 RepID=A0A166BI33_9AGAM|nr:hypothetical protein FIBSPDRAFT_961235 [Fibularhizoctonia sp. CBS 109695]